ncbi:3-phenylpropionic acid transporter [Paenibacillus algicola]|uniref:3-phenylpropionic acid transporter n=1 Tax=Paenibacillus algicola TaxID=2565926 RepID=A0A4P8XR17_9BACL|nr:3-phenylpropionic acid transporter [Paenibacillus algicola]
MINIQRWMSRQYLSFFVTWGVFLPFWTGWLMEAKGLSVAEASLIMSLGLAMRGLSTLFLFPWLSARYSSNTLRIAMSIATLLAILTYIPAESFIELILATVLVHMFYPTIMPALDSAAGILIQRKLLNNYGRSRSFGSAGFVMAGVVLTFFTGTYGDGVVLWALILGMFVFAVLSLLPAPEALQEGASLHRSRNGMLQLFRVRHFGIVLAAVVLLQAAHASYYSYGYIYLQHIEVPTYWIGIIINIAVVAEIIFFVVADRYFQSFSAGSLLSLAAMGSTVRWLLVFAFPNVVVFSISQALHAFSFAMGHYAFMRFITHHIPQSQIPNAQGMYGALALSWSTAILTLFGGFLYEIQPGFAFLGMIVCTLPSLLLALIYRSQERRAALI